MAISGSFYGTTGNSAIKPRINWTAQANLEGNYSDVTVTLTYSRTDSYKTYGYWSGSLTVDGNKKSVSSKYIEITKNSNTLAITYTLQIPHKDDGSKTIAISATGSISGTTLSKTTISGQVPLEPIPRAASIAATDAAIGSVSMVTIGKKSEVYTYTVAWEFGSLSGFLSRDGISQEPQHVTASGLAFSLPESFYYEIPDRPSDICILTCTTYLAGEAIGTPQQATFTVRADPARCAPVLRVAAEDVSAAALALTGNKNRFIRDISTAKCTMTVQPQYGAAITQQQIDGKAVTAASLTLEKIDTDTVRFSVTDSRGYNAEETLSLNLIPYTPPTVRLSAARTEATSGDAVLQIEGNFFAGNFGSKNNSLQVHYRIGDGDEISLTPSIMDSSYSASAQLQGLTYTNAYTLTVTISDLLTEKTTSVRINPGIPLFDWGKEEFSFHVPVSMDGKTLSNMADPVNNRDGINRQYADGRYLQKSGEQTLNGSLILKGYAAIDAAENASGLLFRNGAAQRAAQIQLNGESHQLGFSQYSGNNNGYKEEYYFAAPENLSQNGTYCIFTDKTHGMVKLWQNASPDSSFAAQTVSMDMEAFDGVSVYYRNDRTGTAYMNTGLIPKGQNGAMLYVSTTGKQSIRKFSVGANGVVFETASYDGSGGKQDYIIPVIIYGIKGVKV